MEDLGFAGLWDQPKRIFKDVDTVVEFKRPTWYLTERIIEGLVAAAKVIQNPVLRSAALGEVASDLLSEAEHVYDENLLEDGFGPEAARMQEALNRARSVIYERPGTAAAMAIDILDQLNRMSIDHGVDLDEEGG